MTEKITCYECGCIIEDGEEMFEINGEYICEDCYNDNYVVCDHCGDVEHIDDTTYINDCIVCDYCRDRLYYVCECCNEYVARDCAYETRSGHVCENCYDDNYITCADCGDVIHVDDSYYNEYNNEYYCEDCEQNHKNVNIHDYYYKPAPIFYGRDSALYMGVELEIDGAGEDDDNAGNLIDIDGDRHIYIKHDGSLNEGFEIVSHPATLSYHKNVIDWDDILTEAREMGYKSHDAGTCGLHIHVSKSALGDSYEERDETIAKILYFFEKYYDYMLKFSRRTAEQLDRWASRYGIIDGEKPADVLNKAKGTFNRYKLINLRNDNTIEFRMFRGTLKHSTFIATLQLIQHICDMCIELDADDIEKISWTDFITSIENSENDYSDLLEYLEIKKIKETI